MNMEKIRGVFWRKGFWCRMAGMDSLPPIRAASRDDIPLLEAIAARMGVRAAAGYFEKCFDEGRDIFIAEGAGYVQLNRAPNYAPFRRAGIPEVQDLCVAPDFRRRGIGNALVARCEAAAGTEMIGISVGLYAAYGPAQRLYVRRGYVPDGAGVAYDDVPVRGGEMRVVDDLLTLKLVKSLK